MRRTAKSCSSGQQGAASKWERGSRGQGDVEVGREGAKGTTGKGNRGRGHEGDWNERTNDRSEAKQSENEPKRNQNGAEAKLSGARSAGTGLLVPLTKITFCLCVQ